MLSINACRGFEIGSGFRSANMLGSEHNDPFIATDSSIETSSNHSGGIQGGLSNGMDIVFRCPFKPVASLRKKQNTVDKSGKTQSLEISGRHDPCVVPRAVPIVEAMTAIVLVDHLIRNRSATLL